MRELQIYETRVLQQEAHEEIDIPYHSEEQLLAYGYYRSVGSPRGQIADYRRRLHDGKGIHIRDYGDRMTMHWDHVDPSDNLVGHFIQDAPLAGFAVMAIGAALLGGGS